MVDERNHIYRGFEMTSGVDGKPDGFYVGLQWMRLTTQGSRMNVPIDGVAAGRFADLEGAFNASFQRIRQAIDRHIDG
ncbi:MAG: hypothetical protein RXR52_35350 [Paraburkholderia sp.]|uniref:hypothetical protein n=1 Tax=Burkholderiaceae TaxID=119060 RepID=UPI0010F68BD3|nr:hypothetical protein [Burkholderia sp. 4M9327F10]